MSDTNWSDFKSVAADADAAKAPAGDLAAEPVVTSASDESDEFGGFEAADTPQAVGQPSLDAPSPWLLLAASAPVDASVEQGTLPNEVSGNAATACVEKDCTRGGDEVLPDAGLDQSSTPGTGAISDASVGSAARSWNEAAIRAEAEMMARCKKAEDHVVELQQKIREQQAAYEVLQDRHAKDLSDLMQANKTAVTVLIEEHKEQLKLAVLQQQERCLLDFQRRLGDELSAVKSMCEDQRRAFELMQADALKKQDEAIRQSLTNARTELTAEHEADLAAQTRHHQQLLDKAATEEQARTERAITAAVDAERERWTTLAEQLRGEFEPVFAKLKDDHSKELETELEAERVRTKSYWDTWAEESGQSSRQAAKDAVESAKLEFDAYIEQRKKADQAVLQKSLATVDLLIECARQQLSTVMTGCKAEDKQNASE